MSGTNADVSVIIPAWRAVGTIRRALESVAAQTLAPLEVIVVDDGSDDGTFDAARACASAMGPIRLVVERQDNRGAGAARNRALALAQGRWVAFLDADDEWLPSKIERSMAHADTGDFVLVSHDFLACDGTRETYVDCARHFTASPDPFVTLFKKAYVATTTVVARRDAVIAEGGFDESLRAAQDYDLWLGILGREGAKFVVFPEALTRYHFNPVGITSNVERRRQCSLAVLRKRAHLLSGRGRSWAKPILVRTLVIHYEAASGHWTRGRRFAAIGSCFKVLPSLLNVLTRIVCSNVRQGNKP